MGIVSPLASFYETDSSRSAYAYGHPAGTGVESDRCTDLLVGALLRGRLSLCLKLFSREIF